VPQLNLTGSISAAPVGNTGGSVPSGIDTIPLSLTQGYTLKASGNTRVSVPSPSWQTLPGIGSSGLVTHGDFMWLNTDSPCYIRTTQFDPSNTPIVSVHQVQGLFMMQFPPTGQLSLLEIQGVCGVEYLVTGNI
jgi:hypothetical protein